jgi:hypothetical protein
MYIISFEPKPTLFVTIRNHCSSLILIDRGRDQGHFDNGAYWDSYPAWNIHAGDEKFTSLIPFLATFEGIIVYELRRKSVYSGKRLSPKHTLLFVAWKFEGYKKFHVFAQLIRCNERFNWNTSMLEEYYRRYVNQFSIYTGPIKDTWLMPDGTVLMTELELNVTQGSGLLNMTISEEISNERTRRLEWISLNRWVSLESKLL